MSHHKFRIVVLTVALCIFSSNKISAQQVPEPGIFGGLVTPDILGARTGPVIHAEEEDKWTFSFTPSFVSTDGATLYGGTVQGGFKKVQLDVRWVHIDLDDSNSIGQIRGQAKYNLVSTDRGFSFTAFGSYTDLENVHNQVDIGLSASQALAQRLSVFADVRHIDRSLDTDLSIDDVGVTVGLQGALRAKPDKGIFLAVDYSLENDFSDADSYSGALTFQLGSGRRLTIGAAKDDVYFVALRLII